jgi:hypothetical protein
MIKQLLLMVTFLSGTAAFAQIRYETSGEFAELCSSTAAASAADEYGQTLHVRGAAPSFCSGYIAGFMSANYVEHPKSNEGPFCVPERYTLGKVLQVIVRHIREHPDEKDYRTDLEVYYILKKNFPCSIQKK